MDITRGADIMARSARPKPITRPELHPLGRQLFREVCAKPWDDAPRLILADWLCEDEIGHDVRGDYIRRAVKLHQREQAGEKDPDEARALREIERKNEDRWRWPQHKTFFDRGRWRLLSDCLFTRGLVSRINLDRRTICRRAPALFACLPVVNFSLGRFDFCEDRIGDGGEGPWDPSLAETDNLLPGPIFRFVTQVGLPAAISDSGTYAVARVAENWMTAHVVSRAAVAFGRHVAGLPPLTPEQFTLVSPPFDRRNTAMSRFDSIALGLDDQGTP
jgi:uncharacterized protein (TIGR02996 family)